MSKSNLKCWAKSPWRSDEEIDEMAAKPGGLGCWGCKWGVLSKPDLQSWEVRERASYNACERSYHMAYGWNGRGGKYPLAPTCDAEIERWSEIRLALYRSWPDTMTAEDLRLELFNGDARSASLKTIQRGLLAIGATIIKPSRIGKSPNDFRGYEYKLKPPKKSSSETRR